MLATYRDSLRELNQGDLGLLETRLETRLIKLEVKLQETVRDAHWETVKWMFTFFGALVLWSVTLAVLATATRR